MILEPRSQDRPGASKEAIVIRNALKPKIGEFAELAKLLIVYKKYHPIQGFVKIIVPYEVIQAELFRKHEMNLNIQVFLGANCASEQME